MTAILCRQAGAGVVREARGTIGQVRNRRHNVRGLACEVRVPQLLGVPGATRDPTLQELVTDSPATVATFDHVHPTGFVPAVGVVVAGEQVAVLVERQLLRVAQSVGEHFEFRAIGIAPQHRTGVGHGQGSVFGFEVKPAVADAEVEPTIGAHPQAMEVVTEESDVHAEAVVE